MNNGRIGDVFEYISRGKSPQYVDQSSVHVINQACIRWDGIDFSKVKYQNPTTIKKDAILNVGDLLISSTGTGTLGRCCVFDGGDESITYVADSHVTVIRKSDIVLPSFAKYYLMHDATQRELYAQCVNGSTNQIELSKEKFKKFLIPVPSKEVQQSIVIILEKIEKLIALRKEQLAKLDQLVKSRFIELFGDQETNPYNLNVGKLSDVAEIYLGLTHTPTYVEQGKPFLSVRDISSGVIDFSNCHYITEEEFCSLPNGARPRIGDMLFCRVGTIGKPVIIPENTPEFGTFVSVGYLRRKANVNNYYLKSWMENDFFMRQVYDNVAGASQINLNTGWLKNFRILIPSMEQQNQFATFVEQTDKSKLAIQQSLDKLELLKKSLMQEYFG